MVCDDKKCRCDTDKMWRLYGDKCLRMVAYIKNLKLWNFFPNSFQFHPVTKLAKEIMNVVATRLVEKIGFAYVRIRRHSMVSIAKVDTKRNKAYYKI